ncbi:MAG: tRNA (adenosine(37)-N6)-threonylcarbamoyltransferase complex dimerization subunit type 1 TsaB [Bacteroidia bacterium]|jgi:tRNA threonylcarbamoyladenosine biosynthesis protein TsaB|nr:tRNA (adenosine(37)-N6)-threonylcarbamoyltransferase complex dimerization subunit type 1 TsaB [Bacteroidia bacterium]
MPVILCLETSTPVCSVAIASESGLLSLVEDVTENRHASHLTIYIEQALQQAGLNLQQVDAIAVSKGPGSYTGLRVGVSTAKGFCYALKIPLLGVGTLQGLALQMAPYVANEPKALLIPMLDARRMEVYNQLFNAYGNALGNAEATVVDSYSFLEILDEHTVYFAGPGAPKCSPVIQHPNAIFLPDIRCSASSLFAPALALLNNQQVEDVAYMEPFYLKDFVGTTPKKRV